MNAVRQRKAVDLRVYTLRESAKRYSLLKIISAIYKWVSLDFFYFCLSILFSQCRVLVYADKHSHKLWHICCPRGACHTIHLEGNWEAKINCSWAFCCRHLSCPAPSRSLSFPLLSLFLNLPHYLRDKEFYSLPRPEPQPELRAQGKG